MAVNDIIGILKKVVAGLGLNSVPLSADEEERIRQLAKEISEVYDRAVERYRAKLR